jgi:hypothetical protein
MSSFARVAMAASTPTRGAERHAGSGNMLGRVFGQQIDPPIDVPRGVVIRAGSWIPWLGGWLSGHRQSATAVTLGSTIIVHPTAQLTRRLLQHELAHVRQWRQRPFTFPLRYAWQHIRHGYRNNPFEVEARDAERTQS